MSLSKRLINTDAGGGGIGCYDLANGTLAGTSNTYNNYFSCILVNNTGTKAYPMLENGDGVQVDVTDYLIDTSSPVSNFPNLGISLQNMKWGNSGTILYACTTSGIGQKNVSAYTVPTGTISITYNHGAGNSYSFNLSNDGTKLFVAKFSQSEVLVYNLSTAWNVSTASYSGVSKNVQSQCDGLWDIEFNSTGTEMFLLSFWGSTIQKWTMSSPYDITSAVYDSAIGVSSNTRGFCFASRTQEGDRLYAGNSVDNKVRTYYLCP